MLNKALESLISKATTVPPGFASICRGPNNNPIIAYHLAQYIIEDQQIIGLAKGLFKFTEGYYKFLERPEFIKKDASKLISQSNAIPTIGLLNEFSSQLFVLSCTEDKEVNPGNMHIMQNGILKLNIANKSIDFIKHNPNIIFTFKSEAGYNLNQDCQTAQKFLDEVLPDKNHQKLFLEALGFAIFPALRQKIEYTKATLMYGAGSNGKTLLQGFCIRMIGPDACSSTSLDQIIGRDKFQIGSMYLKRANFSSENESAIIKETKMLKAITSGKDGDMVDVEFKFVNPFKAKVNPILIFAVNKELFLPESRTFALERRLNFIDFPNIFSNNPKDGEKLADNRLEDKDFTQPIVDGLLGLTIKAVEELLKRGHPWEEGTKESLKKAILKGSHIERFIDAHIVPDREAKTSSKEVYGQYLEFCFEEGLAEENYDRNNELKPKWHDDRYDKTCKSSFVLTKNLCKRLAKHKIKPGFLNKERCIERIRLIERQDNEEETMAYQENPTSTVNYTPERRTEGNNYSGNNIDASNSSRSNSAQTINNDDVAYSRISPDNIGLDLGTPSVRLSPDGVQGISDKYNGTSKKDRLKARARELILELLDDMKQAEDSNIVDYVQVYEPSIGRGYIYEVLGDLVEEGILVLSKDRNKRIYSVPKKKTWKSKYIDE